MAEQFNAYTQWMGIPAAEQPPHAYRLLGLELFEASPASIAAAAQSRIAQLKTNLSGPHRHVAEELIRSIEIAAETLADQRNKAKYDRKLNAQLKAGGGSKNGPNNASAAAGHSKRPPPRPKPQAKTPTPSPIKIASPAVAILPTEIEKSTSRLASIPEQPVPAKPVSRRRWPFIALGGAVLLLVAGAMGLVGLLGKKPEMLADGSAGAVSPPAKIVSAAATAEPEKNLSAAEAKMAAAKKLPVTAEEPSSLEGNEGAAKPVHGASDTKEKKSTPAKKPAIDKTPQPAKPTSPLAMLPRSVALPTLAALTEEGVHEEDYVPLFDLPPNAAELNLMLLAPQSVQGDVFKISGPAPFIDKLQWDIFHEAGDGSTNAVGRFRHDGKTLYFAWVYGARKVKHQQLQNCLLRLSLGFDNHLLKLRQPIAIEPLRLDLTNGSAEIVHRVVVADLPSLEHLKASIKVTGIPGHRVEPNHELSTTHPIELITKDGMISVHIQFHLANSTSLKFTAVPFMAGPLGDLPLMQPRDLDREVEKLAAAKKAANSALKSIRKRSGLSSKERSRKELPYRQRLTAISHQIEQVQKIQSSASIVSNSGLVHIHISAEVEGHKILIAASDLPGN